MARIILNREIARRFTDGETEIEISEDNIRAVIRALEARYPGIGTVLRTDMAVAINGQIYQDALLEQVPPDAEVAFIPAIEGG